MVGVDSEMGSSVLRLWIAAGSAAVLVAICAVAFNALRTNAARAGIVALGALVGVAMIWALLGAPVGQDHGADRRALEMRAQELTARTLAPGSALACLDAVAGENVDAACEKALFASPATVAAATSYAAARLELLSDMAAYVKHGGRDIDGALLPLRHSLETDAYGFLAHALAVRDGCTSQNCKALDVLGDVLGDANRVRANLSEQTLDRYLDRYLTAWAQQPNGPGPVADAAPQSQPTYQPGAPGQRKVVVNIDFPTAASIPPVSIMNPEPGTKPTPAGAASSAANPNPPAPAAATASAPPSKKSRKQAANPQPQAPAPTASTAPAMVVEQPDPVWTPAPPAPPAQAAATAPAPAANFVSGGAGPVQLTPFGSQQ
jgi:hypothetical protein